MASSPTRHDLSQMAYGIFWNWNVCGSELRGITRAWRLSTEGLSLSPSRDSAPNSKPNNYLRRTTCENDKTRPLTLWLLLHSSNGQLQALYPLRVILLVDRSFLHVFGQRVQWVGGWFATRRRGLLGNALERGQFETRFAGFLVSLLSWFLGFLGFLGFLVSWFPWFPCFPWFPGFLVALVPGFLVSLVSLVSWFPGCLGFLVLLVSWFPGFLVSCCLLVLREPPHVPDLRFVCACA